MNPGVLIPSCCLRGTCDGYQQFACMYSFLGARRRDGAGGQTCCRDSRRSRRLDGCLFSIQRAVVRVGHGRRRDGQGLTRDEPRLVSPAQWRFSLITFRTHADAKVSAANNSKLTRAPLPLGPGRVNPDVIDVMWRQKCENAKHQLVWQQKKSQLQREVSESCDEGRGVGCIGVYPRVEHYGDWFSPLRDESRAALGGDRGR